MKRCCFQCGGDVPEDFIYDYCAEHEHIGKSILADIKKRIPKDEAITDKGVVKLSKLLTEKKDIPENADALLWAYLDRKTQELKDLREHIKNCRDGIELANKILAALWREKDYGK